MGEQRIGLSLTARWPIIVLVIRSSTRPVIQEIAETNSPAIHACRYPSVGVQKCPTAMSDVMVG